MRILFSTFAIGLLLASPIRAGDDGLSGNWKFHIYQDGGQQLTFWLLHMESKDGKLAVKASPLRGGPKVAIEDAKVVGDALRMKVEATFLARGKPVQVSFDYEGKLPKPGAKKIYGSLNESDGAALPAVLEATSAKSVFELDRDLLVRTPSDPKALLAIVDVIAKAKENNVPAKGLQDWVEGSLKTAELYGPRIQLKQQIRLLGALQDQPAFVDVAVETARSISKQIDAKAPMDTQSQLLSTIAGILRAGKQNDEAKAVETRIDKLELPAFAEYSKSALNYKVTKYAGRKAKSNRAVLVELFTGAQCPPCVAADMAFDGVEKTYDPSEVVLLQYHMHIPRPEPMSNADSEARFDWYSEVHGKSVGGTPAALFNGKPEVTGGGRRDDAEEKYKEYCGVINKDLEMPATVKVSAAALRKGDQIAILASVADLDKPGDKVRLRLALVEDWVRYKGSNGMQYHHRVVRALPGGAKGIALKDKSSEHRASVDLVELRKSINKYLDDDYPDGPRPLRMRNLSVVAFVQNDQTTEVLQAVNVPVREEQPVTWIALKMLTGNRGKYYAIVFGIAFACMLMAQQASIFVGLMRNTTSQIRDIQGADIWVMDPSVEFIDDITPLSNNAMYRVRSVPGVAWAVQLYKGLGRAQFQEGSYKQFIVLGLDDETFVGAPQKMLVGSIADLRRPDAVIMDEIGYRYLWPGQPLAAGRTFEMNDHRAKVVGICRSSPTFQTFPIIYTRYSQALLYAPQERRVLSFVLAKGDPSVPAEEVCERIFRQTGMMAATNQGFAWMTISYYMRRTGIPINFGTTVLLGFIIGAAIAGQTFYLFTIGNLKQYGALKAMGATNLRLVGMVLVQGLFVGAIGFCLGMGMATSIEWVMRARMTTIPPAVHMAWQIPVGTAMAVFIIVIGSTFASLRRVLVLEPASVFK